MAHEGVDLGVEYLLVQQVKVSKPLAALHHVLQPGVSKLGGQVVLEYT
jgi:hypothetical protein